MKEGDFIMIINKNLFTPQKRRVIHMYSKEYILGSKSSKFQSKMSTSSQNSNNSKRTSKNSNTLPKSNIIKQFSLEKQLSILNSRYKHCLKSSIINSNYYELLQKKIKILDAEENKIETLEKKYQKTKTQKTKKNLM